MFLSNIILNESHNMAAVTVVEMLYLSTVFSPIFESFVLSCFFFIFVNGPNNFGTKVFSAVDCCYYRSTFRHVEGESSSSANTGTDTNLWARSKTQLHTRGYQAQRCWSACAAKAVITLWAPDLGKWEASGSVAATIVYQGCVRHL